MNELIPILSGIIAGGALAAVRPRMRLRLAVFAALTLGTLATLITGEYEISWGFLLIDIPLAGISSIVGLIVFRYLRRPRSAPAP